MIAHTMGWIRESLKRDPWLTVKFTLTSGLLFLIGKALYVGAVEGCGVPVVAGQFVPTLPMLWLTFLAHRYVWRRQEVGLLSYVGGCWTGLYAAQFVIGHSMLTICTTVLGWQYLLVSTAIGFVFGFTTFFYNELKVFADRNRQKTDLA